MDRERLLESLPRSEDNDECECEANGRYQVGDAETDMDHIGAHRSKHAHHDDRGPVSDDEVARASQLPVEDHEEDDRATEYPELGRETVHEEVRCRLAHRSRQQLQYPKRRVDVGNLARAKSAVDVDLHVVANLSGVERGEVFQELLGIHRNEQCGSSGDLDVTSRDGGGY